MALRTLQPARPQPPASSASPARTWPNLPWPEILAMVLHDLERNLWRTVLTMLGLVIGSAAVVAVTSVGLAGRDYAIRQLESLGTNFIWISYNGPSDTSSDRGGARGRRELNDQDFDDIQREAAAVATVTRVVVLFSSVSEAGRTSPISLVGTDANYARVRNLTLAEGHGLTPADIQDRRKVCLLAHSLAAKLYGRQSALHRDLKIEDFNFEVVGVFRDVVTPGVQTEISGNSVVIPISVARFFTADNTLDTIYAQAVSRDRLGEATQQIRRILARNHGRGDLYGINDLTYFVQVVHRISVGLIIVVILLGAIALVVGGVGILNIMLISVSERTREIGMRVAVGARRREILRLFFTEALVISLTGGAVGIVVGSLGPVLIQVFLGVRMPVSLLSIGVAMLVSLGVGISFGIYPALQAARLDPAVALRHE